MTIKVQVNLFADMERYHPGSRGSFSIELPDGSTVDTLLAALGVPRHLRVIAAIGGSLAQRSTRLQHNDEVELLTPMTGGSA